MFTAVQTKSSFCFKGTRSPGALAPSPTSRQTCGEGPVWGRFSSTWAQRPEAEAGLLRCREGSAGPRVSPHRPSPMTGGLCDWEVRPRLWEPGRAQTGVGAGAPAQDEASSVLIRPLGRGPWGPEHASEMGCLWGP